MKELVTIQLGQCGNQVGHQFWSTILPEHAMNPNGLCRNPEQVQGASTFFDYIQTAQHHYQARCVLADLDPGVLDSVRSSDIGPIFKNENFLSGQYGGSSNWAKGYYADGEDLAFYLEDIVRKEVESCDGLSGFQLIHSIGGGTGSGMGSKVLSDLRDSYSSSIISTYSVFPSTKVSDTVTEPYNAVLSIDKMIQLTNMVFVLDNQALYDISRRQYQVTQPTYGKINQIIASAMSTATCSMRFGGPLNSSLRKLCTNLVPFPRLHFFTTTYAQTKCCPFEKFDSPSVMGLNKQLFDPRNCLCAVNPLDGQYFTGSLIYRGQNISTQDVQAGASAFYRGDRASHFSKWIPDNLHSTICSTPAAQAQKAGMFIGNATAVQHIFKRLDQQFSSMIRRKAFVHWYTAEGMEEFDFVVADSNMCDLVSEYYSYQEATVQQEFDFDLMD